MDFKRIIKEYYEQFYAHKFDNLDEMYQFLERHNLSKLTQEEYLNSPRSMTEDESISNNLLKERSPVPDGFTVEFYQPFEKEIISIFYNLFQKRGAEGILPNSFYEVSITLIPKPGKDITIKENYKYLS